MTDIKKLKAKKIAETRVMCNEMFTVIYSWNGRDTHTANPTAHYFALSEAEAIGKFFQEFGLDNGYKITKIEKEDYDTRL